MAKLQALRHRRPGFSSAVFAAVLLTGMLVTGTGAHAAVENDPAGFDKWAAEITYAGYLGDVAGGAMREWNETHAAHISVGVYKINGVDYSQLNLGYTYRAPWSYRFENADDLNWHFLSGGVYLMRSLDNTHYFRTSPSKYPSAGYYDETALRFGFTVGTSVSFFNDTTELKYFFMILDNGLIAWYNNQRERDLISYFVSHGLSLSYRF